MTVCPLDSSAGPPAPCCTPPVHRLYTSSLYCTHLTPVPHVSVATQEQQPGAGPHQSPVGEGGGEGRARPPGVLLDAVDLQTVQVVNVPPAHHVHLPVQGGAAEVAPAPDQTVPDTFKLFSSTEVFSQLKYLLPMSVLGVSPDHAPHLHQPLPVREEGGAGCSEPSPAARQEDVRGVVAGHAVEGQGAGQGRT